MRRTMKMRTKIRTLHIITSGYINISSINISSLYNLLFFIHTSAAHTQCSLIEGGGGSKK